MQRSSINLGVIHMGRTFASVLLFHFILPLAVFAQDPVRPATSGQQPSQRPVTKDPAGTPGLFLAEMDVAGTPKLAEYRKKLEERGITILEANPIEGGRLTRVVLYISNREQLGQAQYDLDTRLSSTTLPRPVNGQLDTDYNRLLQTSTRGVYARLYYDSSLAESGKIQESFQAFKQQVNNLSVQFSSVYDADGKKVSATRASDRSREQYTLPFQGSIVYAIRDLRDAYRFQMMVSACSIAERVELIEPQQATQGQQRQAGANDRFIGQNQGSNNPGAGYQNGGYEGGNYQQAAGNSYYDQNGLGNVYGPQQGFGNNGFGQRQGLGFNGYGQPQGAYNGYGQQQGRYNGYQQSFPGNGSGYNYGR